MQTTLDIVTILSVGWMIGTELAVSVFVNPVLAQLDARAEMAATRFFGRRLGRAMPFWYFLGFALLTVEALLRRQETGIAWLIVAASLFALSIVMSLLFLVPINNRIVNTREEVLPDHLKKQHRAWARLHHGRVLILAAAMVLFLVGISA